MPSLTELLAAGSAIDGIASHLDSLDHEARVREVRSLSRSAVPDLFERAAGRPVGLDHFVPPEVPTGTPVRHHGINSLPLFRKFEKRFVRPAGSGRLWGYNHQAMGFVTGPGYFVVEEAAPGQELAIDYYQVPDGPPPAGWPPVRRNETFPTSLVYGYMKDFMRRVSRHVSVGRAHKKGVPQKAWFVLVRQDP